MIRFVKTCTSNFDSAFIYYVRNNSQNKHIRNFRVYVYSFLCLFHAYIENPNDIFNVFAIDMFNLMLQVLPLIGYTCARH